MIKKQRLWLKASGKIAEQIYKEKQAQTDAETSTTNKEKEQTDSDAEVVDAKFEEVKDGNDENKENK